MSVTTSTEPRRTMPNAARNGAAWAGLVVLLVIVFGMELALGSARIPFGEVLAILGGRDVGNTAWTRIVQDIRLPRATTALLAGSALGAAGLAMQTLFRNPLADPYVLGISSGANLGVALVVLAANLVGSTTILSRLRLGGNVVLVVAAGVGAGTVLMLVMLVARRVRNNMTLLILGMLLGYVASAIVAILVHFSTKDEIAGYIRWTLGNFAGVTWQQMNVLAPAAVFGLLAVFFLTKPLNALLLGENYARTMGLNIKRARLGIIISAAILAGATTAFCGPIGFLGIAIPHLARGLFRSSDHRTLVPAVVLLGAIVALSADLLAELPGIETTLPLNAVTALIGAPVVLMVILRRRGLGGAF